MAMNNEDTLCQTRGNTGPKPDIVLLHNRVPIHMYTHTELNKQS